MRVIAGDREKSAVVAELECLLEKAKAGSILGFVCLVNDRNAVTFHSAGQWTAPEALFAFEVWKNRQLSYQ